MLETTAAALVLGFWAGVAPGPLLALVVSESVKGGFSAGARVALAPLISDIPIVAAVLFASFFLADSTPVFGVLGLAGAAYILWLGISGLRSSSRAQRGAPPDSTVTLGKGVLVNLLNPHPYLFWLGVGAPLLRKAHNAAPVAALAFVGVFYAVMVGTKLAIASLSARAGSLLDERCYRQLVRLLDGVLVLLALWVAWASLAMLWG